MRLKDLFKKPVITAGPQDSLTEIVRRMQEHNVGTVIITENQRPVGIVTDRDVALAVAARGVSPQVPVREVMTRHVLAIPEDMGIFTATRFIQERGVRRLPIVDGEDRVVGIVSVDDLLQCLSRELHNLAEGIELETKVQ